MGSGDTGPLESSENTVCLLCVSRSSSLWAQTALCVVSLTGYFLQSDIALKPAKLFRNYSYAGRLVGLPYRIGKVDIDDRDANYNRDNQASVSVVFLVLELCTSTSGYFAGSFCHS